MLVKTLIVVFIIIFFSGCATPRNGLYISTKKIDEKELLKAGFEKTHEQVSYSGGFGILSADSMLDEYNGDLLTNITVNANYWWLSGIDLGDGKYKIVFTADVWRRKSPCDKCE